VQKERGADMASFLREHEHIFSMFQQITPHLLCASKRINSIPYDELSPEEVNELEVTEKGVSIQTFRE
jgi:hypothetical protein